jgi:GH15 family glucan-1,4-alpha-glucosidase
MPQADRGRALDYALVGNCSYGALIDERANVVWACLPRFDSDPTFNALLRDRSVLEGTGVFAIDVLDFERCEQEYLENTAVLCTRMFDCHGAGIEVTDFAPRFKHYGRIYRPLMLVRQVKPIAGSPRVRVLLRPTYDAGAGIPALTHGSNHIRYVMPGQVLRLTTDASIIAILDELPQVVEHPFTLILGPDETVEGSVGAVGRHFFEETRGYWQEWVRYLGIPFEWQEAVIRAAITLKLNAYDDTGAIIAAVTTSIPEAPGSGRNWDYRYCWLRDAHFVVRALGRLATTQTLERYLSYIINIVANGTDGRLQPVYCINGASRMDERTVESLPGYRGMGPVRFGNQAYAQVQNDVYGATILAATHVFFDRRVTRRGDEALFRRLELLGEVARQVYDQPDAGLWERRGTQRVHTFSSVMCWVACERLALIARQLDFPQRAAYWQACADEMHAVICRRAWNAELGSFVECFDGEDLDASLLLLHDLGFIDAADPRFAATVASIERNLRVGDFVFRYVKEDDFGRPATAFTICTFWYVDALAALGRRDEARRLFENLLACRNCHGLLSEDINPETRELWGNFPQTYSMVGLISSAMLLSKRWEEIF